MSDVLKPGYTSRTLTDKLASIVFTPTTPTAWFVVLGFAFMLTTGLIVALCYLLLKGVGIWGNNVPVGWAFDIINFVWWIGIGHAGTLISAILLKRDLPQTSEVDLCRTWRAFSPATGQRARCSRFPRSVRRA